MLRNFWFWAYTWFQNPLWSQRDQAILQENIPCFLKEIIPGHSLNLLVNLRQQWWWGRVLIVCLLTPYIFLLPLPSAQLAHKILLVFWGRGRKGLSLTCSGFGSSCLIGHHVCSSELRHGRGDAKRRGKEAFLVLLDHCLVCSSAMCRFFSLL